MSTPALVHRPAPRLGVGFGMLLLAAVVLPGPVLQPEGFLTPGGVFGLLVFLAFELALVTLLLRRVDVFVEGDEVRLVSKRFPLATVERRYARGHVAGVTLERGRRRTVRLALRMTDGAQAPLTQSYFGHSSQTDRDGQALAKALGVSFIAPA